MRKNMNIGIGHGYYAIKTRHFSFPAGISEYSHEPYTLQNTLEYGGKFLVCGTGRQPILRNKMENDNYYLLTLAAIAREIKQRGGKTECSVNIAAGLPLAGFGREKKSFREYLLRSPQPVGYQFEGIPYKVCEAVPTGVLHHRSPPRTHPERAVCPSDGRRRLDGGFHAAGQRHSQRIHMPQSGTRHDPLHG